MHESYKAIPTYAELQNKSYNFLLRGMQSANTQILAHFVQLYFDELK